MSSLKVQASTKPRILILLAQIGAARIWILQRWHL